jgi:two-component system LytT family sensor kinase
MLDYYVINNAVIPELLYKKRYGFFIPVTVLVIAASALLRSLVSVQMRKHVFTPASTPDFLTLYLNSLINISLWVLIVIAGKMFFDRIRNHQQLELLEKKNVQYELDFLKAQINPHSFFNSLNTIYGSIDKNNQAARDALLRFSELLRYQLYDCSSDNVSIEKEIAYIKNYVAFQKLRKDERLAVRLEIGEIKSGALIAPILLVVLIENAFKYVSNSSDSPNEIHIHLYMIQDVLHFHITNTVDGITPSATRSITESGIGIGNLKRRLDLIYPQKYTYLTDTTDGKYTATLLIDLS